MKLANEALFPPYLEALIVRGATELLFQLRNTLAEQKSFDDNIEYMTDTAETALASNSGVFL
jgi:hypothetical protein